MKIGAIIFSRMNSSRLPGKAFMDISGKLLIERVIERAKCLKSVNHIVIATTTNLEDDQIAFYAKSKGLDVYRGSENDVAGRAINACRRFDFDHFLRICGDRPFFDTKIYDDLISKHISNQNDLTTNIFPRAVSPGFTGEIIKVNALEKIVSLTSDVLDREHVTRYFYKNPTKFSIMNVKYDSQFNIEKLRFVIDDHKDLERARWISNEVNRTKYEFNSKKIISLNIEWEKKYNN